MKQEFVTGDRNMEFHSSYMDPISSNKLQVTGHCKYERAQNFRGYNVRQKCLICLKFNE